MDDSRESSLTSQWITCYQRLYQSATRHPFILAIADGSINVEDFKRWLGQDYHFVKAFVRFLASLLLKMPKESRDEQLDTLLGGIAALRDELNWFRTEATRWSIQLDHVILKLPTRNYCKYLEQLSQENVEYVVALTALWAIESIYYESFAICVQKYSKTPRELQEACSRWSNIEFKKYCLLLKEIAERYLADSDLVVKEKAEEVFVQVLEQEVKFWDMSLCGESV